MSPTVVAFLSIIGILCVINLLLLFAVIRRLRLHEEQLGRLQQPFDLFSSGLDVGARVPDFSASAREGEEISTSGLAECGAVSIAFVSAACDACEGKFADFVTSVGQSEDTCIAVISDDPAGTSSLARRAEEEARLTVILEGDGGPLTNAFRVAAFPMFFRLREGHVVTKAASPRGLSADPTARDRS